MYELLATLGIISLVIAAGVSFLYLMSHIFQTTEVNALIGNLNMARSEAIKRGRETVLCPSADGRSCDSPEKFTWWHRGMLLFVDTDGDHQPDPHDPVIHFYSPKSSNLQIKSSSGRTRVTYQPNGLAPGTNLSFTFCDPRGTERARYVIISNSGRARVSSAPADGKADEALERCP